MSLTIWMILGHIVYFVYSNLCRIQNFRLLEVIFDKFFTQNYISKHNVCMGLCDIVDFDDFQLEFLSVNMYIQCKVLRFYVFLMDLDTGLGLKKKS